MRSSMHRSPLLGWILIILGFALWTGGVFAGVRPTDVFGREGIPCGCLVAGIGMIILAVTGTILQEAWRF